MSIIERQTELGRSIVEINTNTVKELATLQRENVENYFSTNRTFGEKLPEVKDLSSLVSLQREYTEALWKNVSQTFETQNGIATDAKNKRNRRDGRLRWCLRSLPGSLSGLHVSIRSAMVPQPFGPRTEGPGSS